MSSFWVVGPFPPFLRGEGGGEELVDNYLG